MFLKKQNIWWKYEDTHQNIPLPIFYGKWKIFLIFLTKTSNWFLLTKILSVMKQNCNFEPQFQELEAPVYTFTECHDIVSVIANCMSDFHHHDSTIREIEEYINRFPFIRKETVDHILDVMASHMCINE